VEAKRLLLSQLQERHAEAAAMTRRILEEAKYRRNASQANHHHPIERCAQITSSGDELHVALPSEEIRAASSDAKAGHPRVEQATGSTCSSTIRRKRSCSAASIRFGASSRADPGASDFWTAGSNPARIEESREGQRGIGDIDPQGGRDAVYRWTAKGASEVMRLLGRLKSATALRRTCSTTRGSCRNRKHLCGGTGLNQQIANALDVSRHRQGSRSRSRGSHAAIGAEFLKKHGTGEVCRAWPVITTNGTAYDVRCPCGAADAISASVPRAQRSMELTYTLEKLEAVANAFPGWTIVTRYKPAARSASLCSPMSLRTRSHATGAQHQQKIEQELQYPGQIKSSSCGNARGESPNEILSSAMLSASRAGGGRDARAELATGAQHRFHNCQRRKQRARAGLTASTVDALLAERVEVHHVR